LLRAPMLMLFTSPRKTAYGQTDTSSASDTLPMMTEVSSIRQDSWTCGVWSKKERMGFMRLFPL
jgi:hypothetical protein